jgi:hypothetical protein
MKSVDMLLYTCFRVPLPWAIINVLLFGMRGFANRRVAGKLSRGDFRDSKWQNMQSVQEFPIEKHAVFRSD